MVRNTIQDQQWETAIGEKLQVQEGQWEVESRSRGVSGWKITQRNRQAEGDSY